MKTVQQVMLTGVPTIDSSGTVATAASTMLGQNVGILPVLDGDRLRGIVTMRELLMALPYRPVTDVMRQTVAATAAMPVSAAYALMEHEGVSHVPVIDGDRFVGLISLEAALRALGEPVDPLTGLPWAVTLRQRAVECLKDGLEIAIIFIDLDNFGLANKQFGHVIGDRWIRAVAAALLSSIDPSRDLLCRYGGDEFAILTVRQRDDAQAAGRRALEAITALHLPDIAPGFSLSASMGLAGGKRTTERQDVHFEATVDDLINIASRQTTQAKLEKLGRQSPQADPGQEPRLRVRRIGVAMEDEELTAFVELSLGLDRFYGEAREPGPGMGPWRVLAEAAITAINRALPQPWQVAIDEVRVLRTGLESLAAVTVRLEREGQIVDRRAGYVPADGDVGHAVVKAALQAMNRRLALLLSGQDPLPPLGK